MTSSTLKVATTLALLLVAADIWVATRHFAYAREIGRLRASMTTTEQRRSDLIIATERDKIRMELALAKHQAQWDSKLHLSIAADSGHMYLQRDGALLRDMRVSIAPDRLPSMKQRTTTATIALGQRTIVQVDTSDTLQLLLSGGTRIYASDDTLTPVTPGDVRTSTSDFKAVLPNISAGMNVYFY
jgi:hypothetical protein